MPTYEYACQGCGHEFEMFQRMSEPVKRKCPECGRLKLQRLIGMGAGIMVYPDLLAESGMSDAERAEAITSLAQILMQAAGLVVGNLELSEDISQFDTTDAAAAALVIVFQMVGFAAVSPMAGVLADRFGAGDLEQAFLACIEA